MLRFDTTSNMSNKFGQLPWQVVRSISILFHPWVRHFLDTFNFCVQYYMKETAFEFKSPLQIPRHILQGSLLKGYCQLVGCGSICGTKTKTIPLTTVSVIHFSLFPLETENNFYKQCWLYLVFIQKIILVKNLYKKPAILNQFVML